MKAKSCLTNLIAAYDEMTSLVDKRRAVDTVYVGFSTVFDTVSPNNLTDKLMEHRLDVQIRRWGGLRTAWTAGLKGLWSVTQSPAEGQSLVVYTSDWGQYWNQYYFTSSTMAWMVGQSASPASLQIIQNWKEWLVNQIVVLPFHRDLNRLDKWTYSILSCIRKCCQQVEVGDPSHLFSTGETKLGIVCPIQDFPVQETQTWSKSSLCWRWLRAHDLQEEAETWDCSPCRTEGSGGNTWWEGVKKMESDSSQ